MIAIGLSVCAIIYNSPHLYLSHVFGNQFTAYGVTSLIARVYSWLSFVPNAIIPFILLIHMNYVIVQNVRMSRKLFKANDTTVGAAKDQQMDTRQRTMKSAEIQLTIMLLLVTTLFLILLCPTHVRYIYLSFAKRDTPFKYANSLLIFQVTSKLYATNSGINFLLYCISGQKFRNDLKAIFVLLCYFTSFCHC